MARAHLSDLVAFLAVARERSFTRAAAKLGVSQSALSHTIRRLEVRMGLRLLTRNTRSVSPTPGGRAPPVLSVGPRSDETDAELEALPRVAGQAGGHDPHHGRRHAVRTVRCPRLDAFLGEFPDIKVETLCREPADRYRRRALRRGRKAGRACGERDDCRADRPGLATGGRRFAVVPGRPATEDAALPLPPHRWIKLRLTTYGGLYAWEFEKNGRAAQRPRRRTGSLQHHPSRS